MANPVHALSVCGNVDCRLPAEETAPTRPPKLPQAIDYAAKDFDSYLRSLLDQVPSRLPGWKDRSEADLGMAILELLSYVADHLSYYQDRVANEGFLATASQIESVEKLLRLIDYRMHPGLAARALVLFEVNAAMPLSQGFRLATESDDDGSQRIYLADEGVVLHPELNLMALGVDAPTDPDGRLCELAGDFEGLLVPGSRIYFRDGDGAEWATVAAPVAFNAVTVRTEVELRAALSRRYLSADAEVLGNGVELSHGEGHALDALGTGEDGQTLSLDFAPLQHREIDGEAVSSLEVSVDGEAWREVEDFVESDPTDPHFTLSRDNAGFVTLHFGGRQAAGNRGRVPPESAQIEVRYRSGTGEAGQVGARQLVSFDDPTGQILQASNPQPSFGARDPEDVDLARLLGPRQLRRQERAVTPEDYAAVALAGVWVGGRLVQPLHAQADFRWTGSWTTVFVSLDLPDREPLTPPPPAEPVLRRAFEEALAAKKLAGYDVRVEDARYAELHIGLLVHVDPEHFARHVRIAVERAMASRVHADGQVGFFAPERFDFGQDVYLSDLYAAVMAVDGVAAVEVRRFKRLGDRYPDREAQGFIPIGRLEIARADSDPACPENGFVTVRTCGGKEG